MNKEDAVRQLASCYTYVYDKNQYDSRDAWYVMRPKAPLNHDYRGDCEDFSLTLLFHISDNSWRKFWWNLVSRKAKICFCEVRGGGHAVLRYEGMYADNIQQKFVTLEELQNRNYVFSKILFIPYMVAVKLLVGKYIKWRLSKKS